MRARRHVVGRRDGPAEERLRPEHGKEVAGDELALVQLREVTAGERTEGAHEGREIHRTVVVAVQRAAQGGEVPPRNRGVLATASRVERDELAAVGEAEGLPQRPVDETERQRRTGDADGDGQHRRHGPARPLREEAQHQPEVTHREPSLPEQVVDAQSKAVQRGRGALRVRGS